MKLEKLTKRHDLIMAICDHDTFGKIRIAMIDNDKYLLNAKDLASYLYEDSSTRKIIKDHVDDRHKVILKNKNFRSEKNSLLKLNNRGATFIDESGLYSLVMHSKKKKAKKFQDWIIEDVIPSIRKTGSYDIDSSSKKKKKSAYNILGLVPDKKFKEKVTKRVSELSRLNGMLKGKVWHEFTRVYNLIYHTSLTIKRKNLIEKLGSSNINTREYFDLSGENEKRKALVVLTYMKLGSELTETECENIFIIHHIVAENFNESELYLLEGKAKRFYEKNIKKDKKKFKKDKHGNLVIDVGLFK